MIVYTKTLKLLEDANLTATRLKEEKLDNELLMGQATYYAIKNPQSGKGLDHRSINKLCKYFNCQPGDLMEYLPD
jgi:DNA-binding Xre family transcriptional regulator